MAQFDLYIDVSQNMLVGGTLNPQAAKAPPFVQGDSPTFRIFLLTPTGNPITPYNFIPTAGLSLEAALGSKIGSGSTLYTNQYVWTPSTDPQNPNYWIATFPMNTAAITTLIGAAASAQAWFEVKYVTNGVPTTVLQLQVTVQAAVIQGAGVVVPPGLTPVSAEYVNATFLKQTIVGPFFLVDPNTNKKFAIYVGDDGSLHADPVN